jgi:hypothetical protein
VDEFDPVEAVVEFELATDEEELVEELELTAVVGVETTVDEVVVDLLDNAKIPAPAIIITMTITTTIIAILLTARLKFLKAKLQIR